MKRYNFCIILCMTLLLICVSCASKGNTQVENDQEEEAGTKVEITSETIDEITAELFQTASEFLQIETPAEYQQIAGDDKDYEILKFFNSKIGETGYLYLDLQSKEVFLIPLYGDARLRSTSPAEIVFDVEGYRETEDRTSFPYKFTCLKIDMPEHDFWNGFHGISNNYWVKTGRTTQVGMAHNTINLAQLTSSSDCVQLLYNLPISTTGSPPLQEISFDIDAGICEIRVFNCTIVPGSSIFVPENSYIREIQCKDDGVDGIVTIFYDTSAADIYKIENHIDKDGMPITELRFGMSTNILPSDLLNDD